jgi:signal transduction histidine kinase
MRRLWSSLAFRLVIASLAWTLGLLYIAHLVSVFLLFGAPDAVLSFGHRLVPTTLLAVGIMVLGALIVRHSLRDFTGLRQRLLDVQDGRQRAVTGTYVREVQPVVDALNGLLDHQERRVRDALARAGDLAHGLKTPLAVLSHEAEQASASGHQELADTLRQQIERMRRYIDYHLAHARAAASGATLAARCSVSESVDAIVRTLERLHAERGLAIDVTVPGDSVVRVQREDLDEMLGNLMDNGCKWARARIAVSAAEAQGDILVSVDDDGPGIRPEMREAVLQRGVRADEAAPGSGFGLAIVRELAELYGGSISLQPSPLGGLRAVLRLPAVPGHHSAAVQVQ